MQDKLNFLQLIKMACCTKLGHNVGRYLSHVDLQVLFQTFSNAMNVEYKERMQFCWSNTLCTK